MMNDKKPIHQLGAYKCKIMSVEKKEASSFKGKDFPPKIVVELQAEDGRWIAAKFKLPIDKPEHKWDKRQFEALKKAAGVEKTSELKGKIIAVTVAPGFWEGKVFWNPQGYYDVKYLSSPDEALDAALDDIDATAGGEGSADDLPF